MAIFNSYIKLPEGTHLQVKSQHSISPDPQLANCGNAWQQHHPIRQVKES